MKSRNNLVIILFLFIWATQQINAQQWLADPGIVHPFTAHVTVSSGNNIRAITDGKPQSFWESDNPLPFHYISEKRMNLFLQKHSFQPNIEKKLAAAAFDGNPDSKSTIKPGLLQFHLTNPHMLKLLTLKADITDSLEISVQYSNGLTQHFVYRPSQKFQLTNFRLYPSYPVSAISLKSNRPYDLFELAALTDYPSEVVKFDFGKVQKIGWIASRHLNSKSVQKIRVYTSLNGNQWQFLIDLDPEAIPYLQIPLKKEVNARFIKIVFTLNLNNYQKATLWEFAVYGHYGPYGKPPAATTSDLDFAHAFGINTIWGWGYSVYSDRLKPGTGPDKFRVLTSQLRTYHRLDWDMKNPQHLPDYQLMANGMGTPANPWLNWDREYGYWKTFGYHIDATLTFKKDNFPDSLWKRPFEESFAFGQKFGLHFGKAAHPLLDKIEIGNEPWGYTPDIYQNILAGMSSGIHSVSKVKILPCAVQAYDPASEDNNYITKYLTRKNSQWIAGLNTHIYSYVFRDDGRRVAVMPEDPRSEVWSMANLSRYRDANLPGKKIYVTEFGYDATGGGETCTHPECLSEWQQAIYGVRMAVILWRLGAENFYWYYFANVNYDSFLHNRSGLCSSYKTGFRKKLAFTAFEHMQQILGSYHFYKIIREDTEVYAYLFKDFSTGKKILMAWRPVEKVSVSPKWIILPISLKINKITTLTGNTKILFKIQHKTIQLKLTGEPVFIEFNN